MKRVLAVIAIALGLFAAMPSAWHQAARGIAVPPPQAGRRIALVLGNNAYAAMALKNAVNDATAIAGALKQFQFSVDVAVDLTLKEMSQRIDRFVSQIRPGDIALFYYAGHGMQIQGENFLIPIDFAATEEADAKYQAYSANRIADRLTGTSARLAVVVLDACRNNPYQSTRSSARGLSAMESGRGVSRIAIAVPDYWNGELNTSSIMVLKSIDTLPRPVTAAEQAARPFALGTFELHPTNGRRFATTDELSVFFLIYNAAASVATGKPDVVVDFTFHARPAGQPERYFNKTAPVLINASTLPAAFDLGAGHQLHAGQSVPLRSFAPGEYRLDVLLQDRVTGRKLTREVVFTVY